MQSIANLIHDDPDAPSSVKDGRGFGTLWPEEHSKKLSDLILTGQLSFARIAGALNDTFGTNYSRNAAIGRAGRMGLTNPYQVKTVKKAPSPRSHRAKRSPEARSIAPVFDSVEQVKLRCVEIEPRLLALLDLEPEDCRYPYGDSPSLLFCGHPKSSGSSYCIPHHSLTQHRPHNISEADHERRRRHFIGLLKKTSVLARGVPAA